MVLLTMAIVYVLVCFSLYLVCWGLDGDLMEHGARYSFACPPKPIFYILSFTWGLPTVLLGSLAAFFIFITGHKPKKYGYEWYFELNVDFGLELGIFFIVPKDATEQLKQHEHGHGIQNVYFGPFNLGTTVLPSVIRYWYRKFVPCDSKYDDAWFEGTATASGKALIESLSKDI